MSARDRLLRFVKENESSRELAFDPETGHAVDDSSEHVAALLDEYAHELAERIRARRYEIRAEDWGRSRSKRPYLHGMEAAQKLINTKKEAPGE